MVTLKKVLHPLVRDQSRVGTKITIWMGISTQHIKNNLCLILFSYVFESN